MNKRHNCPNNIDCKIVKFANWLDLPLDKRIATCTDMTNECPDCFNKICRECLITRDIDHPSWKNVDSISFICFDCKMKCPFLNKIRICSE